MVLAGGLVQLWGGVVGDRKSLLRILLSLHTHTAALVVTALSDQGWQCCILLAGLLRAVPVESCAC